MGSLLSDEYLWIDFETGQANERRLILQAHGERHAHLLAAFGARLRTEVES